jgi:hypothetical protein
MEGIIVLDGGVSSLCRLLKLTVGRPDHTNSTVLYRYLCLSVLVLSPE